MTKRKEPTYTNTCRKANWRQYRGIVTLECYDAQCPLIVTQRHFDYSAFRLMSKNMIARRLAEVTQ